MHGLAHRHLHNRKYADPAQGPAAYYWVKFLDRATLVAGVIGPLMVLPQIVKIYASQNATGVSALSWFAFGLLDLPFLIYGFVHKDKPIIITYSLWLAANFIVAAGALIYG